MHVHPHLFYHLLRTSGTVVLEIEKQKLEIERQNIALQKEVLELEVQRVTFALETAQKMVDMLYSDEDEQKKAMLAQALVPDLIQLANGKGLELILPAPKIQTGSNP